MIYVEVSVITETVFFLSYHGFYRPFEDDNDCEVVDFYAGCITSST